MFTKIAVLKLFETGDEFFNVAHVCLFSCAESAIGFTVGFDCFPEVYVSHLLHIRNTIIVRIL